MLLQVMERLLILLRVLSIFIHFWRTFMSELLYLHQTFTDCVSNQYWYVKMSDMTSSYGTLLDFIAFLRLNIHRLNIIDDHPWLKYCFITKVSQIVCLINTHILICWHARCNYKVRKVLKKFLCRIRYSSSNFH